MFCQEANLFLDFFKDNEKSNHITSMQYKSVDPNLCNGES